MNSKPKTSLKNAVLIERYRLDAHLDGHGAQGDVWRATDLRLRRAVVVKIMKGDAAEADPVDLQRFNNEIFCTARLKHPHIINVEDAGEEELADKTLLFYVMPFIEDSRSLSLYLQMQPDGCLDEAETRAYAEQLASALHLAHSQGVIHRDIKAANILVYRDSDDQPALKLLDFGVVRLPDSDLTETGDRIGTPTHWPPEYSTEENATTDAKHDLYAVGLVLYQCLVGGLPERDGPEIVRVREQRPDVSRAFSDLIARLLDPNPVQRPQSAYELQQALHELHAAQEEAPCASVGSADGFQSGASDFDLAPVKATPNTTAHSTTESFKEGLQKGPTPSFHQLPKRFQLGLGLIAGMAGLVGIALLLQPPAPTPRPSAPIATALAPSPPKAVSVDEVMRDQARARVQQAYHAEAVHAEAEVKHEAITRHEARPEPRQPQRSRTLARRIPQEAQEPVEATPEPRRKDIKAVATYWEPPSEDKDSLKIVPGMTTQAELETAIALVGRQRAPVVVRLQPAAGIAKEVKLLGDAYLEAERVHIAFKTLTNAAGQTQSIRAIATMPDGSVGLKVDIEKAKAGYLAALGRGLVDTATGLLNPLSDGAASRVGQEAQQHIARAKEEELRVYVPQGRILMARFGVAG